MQYGVGLAFPVAVLSFLLAGLIDPKNVLLVKDLAKGQAKAVHQRYFDFDAKSHIGPYNVQTSIILLKRSSICCNKR